MNLSELQKDVQAVNIVDEMQSSFLDYSMSVIVSRALPDVRDGLKPVHRRILYAMHEMSNYHNKPYKKSARVIGEVLGKYHPHGDSAVYEALVRLAQDFSMRYCLVDGQGNFGSIDGDSPAAMRYTEVRMKKLAEEFLKDIEKDTVNFGPNYDNNEKEPLVLPAKLPTLLVNGASGIAVGMATNIPPHNLTEVINAILAFIEDQSIPLDDLIKYVSGPDFPTGASICGRKGFYDAYRTGKGIIRIKAKTEIEEVKGRERIVVHEIPYQVNKAKLIEKIAHLVKNKQIEGITDLRDESNKKGIRIVIEVKKDVPAQIILNNLYKQTALTQSFGMNMIALVDNVPRLLNLKEIVREFVRHRREVVTRRTVFELNKAEERAHIMEGLKKALDNLDEVIEIIKGSKDSQTAKKSLIDRFEFSEKQAAAILDMRLHRLTGLEQEKILREYEELLALIKKLRAILADVQEIYKIVSTELKELQEQYGDERKTEILEGEEDFEMEDLIEDEKVVVVMTNKGYIKRFPTSVYNSQRRGGRGKQGLTISDEDEVKEIFTTHTHAQILCFSSLGKVYSLKVYKIPPADRYGKGKAIINLIQLDSSVNERVASIVPVSNFEEGLFISVLTKNGFIKKTKLMAFSNIRVNGIIGLTLNEGDEVIDAKLVGENSEIIYCSSMGKSIRILGNKLRETGRTSRGVISMRFANEQDKVVGMEILEENDSDTLLVVTKNGYGKRTSLSEYRVQERGGQGIFTIKTSDRNGECVGMIKVNDDDDFLLLTDSGKIIRMSASDISVIGRNTQGVRLIKLSDGDSVVRITKVFVKVQDDELEGDSEEEETVSEETKDETPAVESATDEEQS